MSNQIKFWIPGKPATKGSTRSFKDRGGNVRTVAASPKLAMFEAMIRETSSKEWSKHHSGPSDKPFDLDVGYHVIRPKSHWKRGDREGFLKLDHPLYMTKKPDLSKVIRAVEDGMIKIVYVDDAQIRKITAIKMYSLTEGVWITVTEINDA